MSPVDLVNPIPLRLADLVPPPERFARPSALHGPAHVSRVMVHAFLLLPLTGANEEAARLWGAVYLHDLARTHDGVCRGHGAGAARLPDRDADLAAHLARGGVRPEDREAVAAAVTAHSLPREPGPDDPNGRLVRLLKDADGLDRVRLFDLDPSYLRHDAARELIPFAQALYARTWPEDFGEFFPEARRLWREFRISGR